jgi:uncharacterized membrane protein (DUF373 family)
MSSTDFIIRLKRNIRIIEKTIIVLLIIMMSFVLVLATIELAYYLYKSVTSAEYFLISLDSLMDLFGVFLLVLIGIELLDTIKVYLKQNVIHVEVVVLVAIIAIARKVVVLKIEELSGDVIIGIGILILSLAIAYYLIKRTGLFILDCRNNPWEDIKNDIDDIKEELTENKNNQS